MQWRGLNVIEIYQEVYPELVKNKNFILTNLTQEEEKFEKTLENGLKEFAKGVSPFILFTTYGFPIEMTEELAGEVPLVPVKKRRSGAT